MVVEHVQGPKIRKYRAWPGSRTRRIGDFRAWKDHDAYQKSFNR
jgi:hypothetical protein